MNTHKEIKITKSCEFTPNAHQSDEEEGGGI